MAEIKGSGGIGTRLSLDSVSSYCSFSQYACYLPDGVLLWS